MRVHVAVVTEGGAAIEPDGVRAAEIKKSLQDALRSFSDMSPSDLLEARYERLMSYGRFKEQRVA